MYLWCMCTTIENVLVEAIEIFIVVVVVVKECTMESVIFALAISKEHYTVCESLHAVYVSRMISFVVAAKMVKVMS